LENNQEKSYVLLSELHQKFSSLHDWKLRKEASLVEKLHLKMGLLSGYGEPLANNDATTDCPDTSDGYTR
jgi:hypothetical protein